MSALAALATTPLLAVIAIEDLRHHRIRNRYIVALVALAATGALITALGGDSAVVWRAALGAVLAAAPLAATWIARPGRTGGGDVKLTAALGALVGATDPWLAVVVIGFGLAGSLVVALVRQEPRVALAPAMTIACFLAAAGAAVT